MIRIFLNVLALMLAIPAFAQTVLHTCGTSGAAGEELIPRLERNIRALNESPALGRDIQFVPVRFHLVAENDGDGRVLESQILELLCALNEDFLPMNIQFYLKNENATLPQGSYLRNGLTYINNTVIYNDHTSALALMNNLYREPNAMNIWVVANATPPGGGLGVTLGYYSPQYDWIVLRTADATPESTTLTHEIGHFFSLPHPHRGWDNQPFIPNPVPQWAIDAGFTEPTPNPAPATSPGGVATEKMSGSNCATAGDLICDTKPDYNFGFSWNTCNYTGGAMDPDGVVVDPEEKLFMGYFGNCPTDDYFFSDMQQQLMVQDLASNGRDYLRTGYNPNPTPLTAVVTNIEPANNATLSQYNAVFFKWSVSPGAERYLLEIARNSTFPESTTLNYIVNGASTTIYDLEASRNYYFRVRPLTEYSTCVGPGSSHFFKTGALTATGEPSFVQNFRVWPNPVSAFQSAFFELNTTKAFDANIELVAMDGRRVMAPFSQVFRAGNNQIELPVRNLTPGIYWIRMETREGLLGKKLVVGN